MIQAELLNLRSEIRGRVEGVVLESSLDHSRGKLRYSYSNLLSTIKFVSYDKYLSSCIVNLNLFQHWPCATWYP